MLVHPLCAPSRGLGPLDFLISVKAEISLSDFGQRVLVENRGFFGGFFGDFSLLVSPRKMARKSTRKSTAETKHQNPRVISGKGRP